jgi:hypothetical protein
MLSSGIGYSINPSNWSIQPAMDETLRSNVFMLSTIDVTANPAESMRNMLGRHTAAFLSDRKGSP